MIKVYLAARFSRQQEMRDVATRLSAEGIETTSRWIRGEHEWTQTPDHEMPLEVGAKFAREDFEDIDDADCMIIFTDPPRQATEKPSRGGMHVEFGYAIGTQKPLMIIGPRGNVFHALISDKWRFDSLEDAIAAIRRAIRESGHEA